MAPFAHLVLAFFVLCAASAPAAAGPDPAPLDLAAMALTPDDLAVAGWDGLGLQSGWMLSVEELAYRAVWPKGEGAEQDAMRDRLLNAGWQQGHASTFATFWDPNRAGAGREVTVEIVAYADPTGAAKGFASVPDVYATGPLEPVPGMYPIGDEARLMRVDARDPQAGEPAQELALGFRRGRLTASVLLRDWAGTEPAVTVAEALAAQLLTKMERIVQEGQPGLSLQSLSVEGVAYAVRSDYYARFAGEDVRSVYEPPEAFATRTAGYGEAIDVFTSGTEIAAIDSNSTLAFAEILYRFRDVGQASNWLRETPDRFGQDATITAFAMKSEAATVGEESLALSYSRDFGNDGLEVAHTSSLFVRIGAVVAEICLTRTNDPPPAAMLRDLAEAQAACLTANGCLPA